MATYKKDSSFPTADECIVPAEKIMCTPHVYATTLSSGCRSLRVGESQDAYVALDRQFPPRQVPGGGPLDITQMESVKWSNGDTAEYEVEMVNTDGEYVDSQYITVPAHLTGRNLRGVIMYSLYRVNQTTMVVGYTRID